MEEFDVVVIGAGAAGLTAARRLKASGKNVLAVLRHTGRLKEFKHGGMRCWHVRQ